LFRGKPPDLAARRKKVAELYESHFERVVRYVAARIGNLEEAQDLAGEVFLRALRSVDSYRETGAPMEAWIFRIAHNLVANYLRDKSRRPASVPLEAPIPVTGEDPLAGLEQQQQIEELKKAMDQLTEAQRQVLALRFGGQMTSEQVAAVLAKKPGAVREMQSAAIKKLQQVLKSQERPLRGRHEQGL
jgi:RNA polymerase sigma-70 factor (ECF subfamily)